MDLDDPDDQQSEDDMDLDGPDDVLAGKFVMCVL